MVISSPTAHTASTGTDSSAGRARLATAIEHAAHLLPAQGPITVFIHHNTLHAFEHLPFDEAVAQGARVHGCQPYMSEEQYRARLVQGRIRSDDLAAELLDDLDDAATVLVGMFGTRFHLRLAMLEYPLPRAPGAELRWQVAENDGLRRFRRDAPAHIRERLIESTRRWVLRDLRNGGHVGGRAGDRGGDQRIRAALDSVFSHFGHATIESWSAEKWESFCLHTLWRICRGGVHAVPAGSGPHRLPLRHRDALLDATGVDVDQWINELLIRFCSVFLDQGLAHRSWPVRDQGFLRAFVELHTGVGAPRSRWLRGLNAEIARLSAAGHEPLESIAESLEILGVAPEQWEPFLAANLLALKGWAGMLWQTELRGDRVAHPAPPGTLVEYLAVRLLLKRLALGYLARQELGYDGPLAGLKSAARAHRPAPEAAQLEQRAYLVFQLAQVLGWSPRDLSRLSSEQWTRLVRELEAFPSIERRRIYQRALERRYRVQTLDALTVRSRRGTPPVAQPAFQVITCIDEREESFRRHLEEVAPRAETFGAAGFFAVAMYYQGLADAYPVPLCPVVVRPRHYVFEQVDRRQEALSRRRGQWRRWLAAAQRHVHLGSRTFTWGALLAVIFGPLASIPLVLRILFPRLAAQLRHQSDRWVEPPRDTLLEIHRQAEPPGPEPGHRGYTAVEMADCVERLLRDIGLTSGWARLVVVVGHGSSSLNNPHESAYDCGACGGSRGGPNARSLAYMANHPDVRRLLAERGLPLPDHAWFLGAFHNTCNDELSYFDLDRVPLTHRADLQAVREALDEVSRRNAHERCRRFASAALDLTPAEARQHVEARAEDLSQSRPECGHATNAVCLVGRRQRTRGLFLDRRSFLVSYDPTQDDDQQTILTRILQAVVPVCGGINLEYYFSYVDPAGWGCGTKLPHNITSLVGVMDGAASDLRTGLPWQMVEIHEPVRLLFVIETTPEALAGVLDRNPGLAQFFGNGWAQLAVLDPDAPRAHVFRRNGFEPQRMESSDLAVVATSAEWYAGWRDHLEYALVTAAEVPAARPGTPT